MDLLLGFYSKVDIMFDFRFTDKYTVHNKYCQAGRFVPFGPNLDNTFNVFPLLNLHRVIVNDPEFVISINTQPLDNLILVGAVLDETHKRKLQNPCYEYVCFSV